MVPFTPHGRGPALTSAPTDTSGSGSPECETKSANRSLEGVIIQAHKQGMYLLSLTYHRHRKGGKWRCDLTDWHHRYGSSPWNPMAETPQEAILSALAATQCRLDPLAAEEYYRNVNLDEERDPTERPLRAISAVPIATLFGTFKKDKL